MSPQPSRKRPRRQTDTPSLALLVLPFVVFAVAGLTAALHKLLGEPLGATVAAKLADIAQTLALMLVAYGPAMGYVQRQNAIASAHRPQTQTRLGRGGDEQRLERGGGDERREEASDDDNGHG